MSLDTEMNRKVSLTIANKMNFHIQKKEGLRGVFVTPALCDDDRYKK
jgi:hypothetical protein